MPWLTSTLLVLVLIVAQAKVAPGPGITARDEDSSSPSRTMFNIVWGCVSTTIICAWAAIHPNIPPREGPLKRTLRRLELMFWTIVAPEILPSWALSQLLAAITVRDEYNEGKGYEVTSCGIWEKVKRWVSLYEIKESANPAWTIAHGHFLIMGGYHVIEPPDSEVPDRSIREANTDGTHTMETEKGRGLSEEKPEGRVTILTLDLLRELVKDPDFEIRTKEEEITDKSKGDALTKLIFILQSTWFILQCVGRRVQGLNLTHLELTTLALASLNGITFLLWWDKPLGAQAIVPIHLKRKLKDSERVPQKVIGLSQDGIRFRGPERPARSEIIPFVRGIFGACVSTIRDAFRGQLKKLFLLPFIIILLLLLPIVSFAFAFITTLVDLIRGSSSFPPDCTHVPTFYVPRHQYLRRYHILLLFSLAMVFGGIHCFGWNFPFPGPTHTEQNLWRVASLGVIITPICAIFSSAIVGCLGPVTNVAYGLAFATLILWALAYVSARLLLLGLSLALLRDLPPTALIDISWTKFFPHFL